MFFLPGRQEKEHEVPKDDERQKEVGDLDNANGLGVEAGDQGDKEVDHRKDRRQRR